LERLGPGLRVYLTQKFIGFSGFSRGLEVGFQDYVTFEFLTFPKIWEFPKKGPGFRHFTLVAELFQEVIWEGQNKVRL